MTKHVFVYSLGGNRCVYPSVITFEGRDDKPSIWFHVFDLEAQFEVKNLPTRDVLTEFTLGAGGSLQVDLEPNVEVGVHPYSVSVNGNPIMGRPDGPAVIGHPPIS